jgi:hypothetical protein
LSQQGIALACATTSRRRFGALLHMEDETVIRVLAFVMAETLEAHTGTV